MGGLRVLESYLLDVGRGCARIDYVTMDEKKLSTGDFIKITDTKTKKFTVAKVVPLYPSDENKKMIRIDGFIRSNLGSAISGFVEIEKFPTRLKIHKMIITPLHDIPPVDERYIAEALNTVPVVLGDKISVPYFGGKLNFKVMELNPKDSVMIDRTTYVEFVQGEDLMKYTAIRESFKEKEEILKKELVEHLGKDYTPEVAKKILSISEEIDMIDRVRKIAFNALREREGIE